MPTMTFSYGETEGIILALSYGLNSPLGWKYY